MEPDNLKITNYDFHPEYISCICTALTTDCRS